MLLNLHYLENGEKMGHHGKLVLVFAQHLKLKTKDSVYNSGIGGNHLSFIKIRVT